MRDHSEIWRLRLWVWLPALLFFLANAVAFSVYRFGYADQVKSLEADLGEVQKQLQPELLKRKEMERRLQRANTAKAAVRELYTESFPTRSESLTRVTAEVKSLARKAGLNPRSFSYPEQEIEDFGLIKRSFVFGVDGTYVELRQFVNLLEVTDTFLTLEAVSLSESDGAELRMSLTLSTLFSDERGGPEPGAASRRLAERRASS